MSAWLSAALEALATASAMAAPVGIATGWVAWRERRVQS